MEYLCSVENNHQVRVNGFKMLLYLIDAQEEETDAKCKELLKNAVSLQPFLGEYPQNSVTLKTKLIQVEGISTKVKCTNSAKENIELFDLLMSFITNTASNKTMWLEILKKEFITSFYPNICQELNIIDKDDTSGFKTHYQKMSSVLFDNLENTQIVVEIFRQALLLSTQHESTVTESISQYEKWFLNKEKPHLIRAQLQSYFRMFITHISDAIRISTTSNDLEVLSARFIKMISIFEKISQEENDYLSSLTWKFLLEKVVDLITAIARSMNANADILKIFEMIVGNLYGTLFTIWVNSRTTQRFLWCKLKELFAITREQFPVVVQWKRTLLKLTGMLHHFLYNTKEKILTQKEEAEISRRSSDILFLKLDSDSRNKNTFEPEKDVQLLPTTTQEEKSIPYFLMFRENNWNNKIGLFFWANIFHLIGNIDTIQNSDIKTYCMASYVEIYDALFRIKHLIPDSIYSMDPPINELFIPIFLESVSYDDKFKKARNIGCGGFSIMLCHTHIPLSEEMLSYFYLGLAKALSLTDHELTSTILRYTSHLFGYCFPGVNCLINAYLSRLEIFFNPNYQKPIDDNIYIHGIALLSSLICIQDQFSNAEIFDITNLMNLHKETWPDFVQIQTEYTNEIQQREEFASNLDEAKEEKEKIIQNEKERQQKTKENWEKKNIFKDIQFLFDSNEQIRFRILKILSGIVSKNKSDSVTNYVLSVICSLCVAELKTPSLKTFPIVEESISIFLRHISHESEVVSQMSSNYISILAKFSEQIHKLNKDFVPSIITKLSNKIIEELGQVSNNKIKGILPNTYFGFESLVQLLINSSCLLEESQTPSLVFQSTVNALSKFNNNIGNFEVTIQNKSKRSLEDISQNLLFRSLNYMNNFPFLEGPEVISSRIKEGEHDIDTKDQKITQYTQAFSFGTNTLIIAHKLPDSDGRKIRITIRDSTGKYTWDLENILNLDDGIMQKSIDLKKRPLPKIHQNGSDINLKPFARSKANIPEYTDGIDISNVNVFHEMLDYIHEKFNEKIEQKVKKNEQLISDYNNQTSKVEEAIKSLPKTTTTIANAKETEPTVPENLSHFCRLFLSHIGMINLQNHNQLVQLAHNEKLFKSIQQLDSISERQTFSVGVIFQGREQRTALELVSNENGSPLYEEFVNCLGWDVDFEYHLGFSGEFPSLKKATVIFPYFANSELEMVFHVLTRIPNDPQDEKQNQKKQMLSKFPVNIVWCESERDYSQLILPSAGLYSTIIVYPLPNGMFRIQVLIKTKNPFYGPTIDAMILNKASLPFLIRESIIVANKFFILQNQDSKEQITKRKDLIRQIIQQSQLQPPFTNYHAANVIGKSHSENSLN
ncbi:rho gtpase-activating protein [Anaeramoeba ignava]|uniref:Rho gtpase-activating protein n=1 Tax=Anaeramoeba ignava TaxID=1746090 RepID=A0A9Q0LS87_ANAIG|nr:rho gtpase-activating protein [Anaeramoeba ignava]